MKPEEQARLAGVLSRAAGAPVLVAGVKRLTGGASSQTWAVDALHDGRPWPLIMQRAACAVGEAGLSRAGQAGVQALAGRHGVPVADVVAVLGPDDGLGEGFVMARLEGEALAPRWLRLPAFEVARQRLTGQCAAVLAMLHAVPLADAEGLGLPGGSTMAQWQAMREGYLGYRIDLPVFDLAFAWLAERCGDRPASAIVHGDFRSGNLLIGPDGLVAVLDWELAHRGEGAEDLGWLCVNAWRFGTWQRPVGGFGEREDLYRTYEAAGGRPVDRERAQMWEVWGTLRWGLACLQLGHDHVSGRVPSLERAAIGRRVSEVEADLLHLIRFGSV